MGMSKKGRYGDGYDPTYSQLNATELIRKASSEHNAQ